MYRGQELYTHVAFANEAACLTNEVGNMNRFLLPTIRNQLPEVVRNTLKSLGKKPRTWEEAKDMGRSQGHGKKPRTWEGSQGHGKKPRTWEESKKTMTTIPLFDL